MNILSDIFQQSIQREHKTVTIRGTGEQFECFFRKSNDNINRRDTMTMFYDVDAPVEVGALLLYGGNTYLTLNKETAENDVYFKSAIIRTNGVINTHSLSVIGLPFYGDNVNNATSTNTTNISLIDGNIEVMTEDNEESRALKVDDLFNEWGRTWKISNLFYIDGICHIVLEVNANVTPKYNYNLILSTLASYNVVPEDTASISATAYCNEIEMTKATIIYSSSNTEVATIDSSGNISYLADGEVYFTATWQEQNISQSTGTVTVASAPADDSVSIYVERLEEICYDFPETLHYYAIRGSVRDDTIPVSFKIENISVTNNYNTYAKKITITDNGDNTIELSVSGSIMRDKTFDLVAYNEEYEVENRQNIKVVSLF